MSTNNSARQTHVSPGIYTKETDLTYAVKSLGITTLGLVGETVKGPAFQPLLIEDWNEYKDYFGGTNPSKFKGSGYLKYEAPYIAKSYLKQSKQLYMTRVLGLSGSNMGPAWAITAHGKDGQEGNNMLIAILRSRGEYKKTAFVEYGDGETVCEDVYEYDKLSYYAKSIELTPTKSFTLGDGCDKVFSVTTDAEGDGYFPANQLNFGKFTIEVTKTDDTTEKYNVSLNPGDKNYILNVLGSKQDEGNALVYVEELYDVALQRLIEKGYINGINKELVYFPIVKIIPNYNECNDLLSFDEKLLTKKDIGKRYLATQNSINPETGRLWNVHKSEDNGSTYVATGATIGNIYQVVSFIESDGTRAYYYYETGEKLGEQKVENEVLSEAVYVLSDNMFYVKEKTGSTNISPITCDLNNYKEQYRFASTPWIVSELKGDAQNVEMVKLFRFHTISDGNAANIQIKISIENIKPDDGLFDVVIRSFYDTDASQIVLERYGKCSLVSGTSNYIGLKIGTSDGAYVTKSKYVTVEINDDDKVRTSVPCGFLGYPVRNFKGVIPGNSSAVKVSQPILSYNTMVDEDIKARKQYFGLSDLTGIDEDILAYKGVEAYNGMPEGLTPSFHLDSRLVTENDVSTGDTDFSQTVTVDGETGYTWTTVSRNNVTSEGIEPRIGTEALMEGTIYENVQYRKFTVVPYGGWDGWDVYRSSRTTSDDFKYSKYKGTINYTSGIGTSFDVIRDPLEYNLDAGEKAITSDWYAFLSAIRTFANPKTIDINVLATPGIDYVNDTLLVQEVIEMVEEERADSVYVVTTPDKPFGASDSVSDMYTQKKQYII